MSLPLKTIDQEEPPLGRSLPPARGLDPWVAYYAALWAHLSLLAGVIFVPRHGLMGGLAMWILWIGLYAGLVIGARQYRIVIHDLLVGLSPKEAFGSGLVVAMLFTIPVWFESLRVFPDGFLLVAAAMTLIAVRASLARRLLGVTLLAGWFAAFAAHGPSASALLLGFGISWLLALAMTHLAFTGDLHGLGGWWPVLRAARGALVTAVPASLAALLVWRLWPESGLIRAISTSAGAGDVGSRRPHTRIDAFDLGMVVWEACLTVFLVVTMVLLLYYLRRLLLQRGKVDAQVETLPGQAVKLEYRELAPPRPPRRLDGVRGKIVALWGRWEAAMFEEDLGRERGETAREYAKRLDRVREDTTPPEAMTELLNRAHYGPDDPQSGDVAAMRRMVQDELSRQSLRRQAPVEPLGDDE